MKVAEFDQPFYHAVIDDFLPDELIDKMEAIHSSLEFWEIQTDLFRFLQTSELNKNRELKFFQDELDGVFQRYHPLDNRYYDIFGSAYRKNDYLLCHDDLVDDRVYAFTYYIKDFDGGELVIYENDCIRENKRIAIRRNRLVIFKVGPCSFHEVRLCDGDGRAAFTGWFNSKGTKKAELDVTRALHMPENIQFYELPTTLPMPGELHCLEFEDVDSQVISRETIGPFVDRRCLRIRSASCYLPSLCGYALVHAEHLVIDKDGYILCNDEVNKIDGGAVDIFIFDAATETARDYIKYVDSAGNIVFTVDAVPGHMVVGPRDGHSICVVRADRTVTFKHLIYSRVAA